jgi:ribosomal protein S18 acetylase RimI-like enzyme
MQEIDVGKTYIDELTAADLPRIGWAGGPLHRQHVAVALKRTKDVDYLAVRSSDGEPLSTCGIDYGREADAGVMWQFCTRPDLRRKGLGTLLITAMEQRIRSRGLTWAMLGVEDSNPQARTLYERLGYAAFRSRPDSWPALGPDGKERIYTTQVTDLRKSLRPVCSGGVELPR